MDSDSSESESSDTSNREREQIFKETSCRFGTRRNARTKADSTGLTILAIVNLTARRNGESRVTESKSKKGKKSEK